MIARFTLRIENYTPLIAKIALKHYRRLPTSVKAWVEAEDLIQDGVVFVRYTVMPAYAFNKGTKFSTYLYTCLQRFYNAYTESHTCQKRTMSAEVIREILFMSEQHCDPVFPTEKQDETARSRNALQQLYAAASPHLQSYLDQWFFSRSPRNIKPKSKPFRKARREFLYLAPKYGITPTMCRELLDANSEVLV